jgi:hypothetical protein
LPGAASSQWCSWKVLFKTGRLAGLSLMATSIKHGLEKQITRGQATGLNEAKEIRFTHHALLRQPNWL